VSAATFASRLQIYSFPHGYARTPNVDAIMAGSFAIRQ
jgi:hypothetical protein